MSTSKGWKISSIGDVADINMRPKKDELDDEMLASFIPMKCVEAESGKFKPLGDKRVGECRKGYTPFRDGDVLFAKVTPCMENGKAAVMKELTNGIGFGSTEFYALRPKNDIDSTYLYYFISQQNFRDEAARNMTGAVGLRRVPKPFLAEQPIPMPETLDEQLQIVAEIEKQFTRLDTGVDGLKRVQTNLKRYRASVLKAACEGKLVETEAELSKGRDASPQASAQLHRSGEAAGSESQPYPFETGAELLERILIERHNAHEEQQKNAPRKKKYKEPAAPATIDLPDLPEGWTWATVEQLGFTVGGLTKNPKRATLPNKLPYLRVANVYANELRLDDIQVIGVADTELNKLLVRTDDLLIVEGNGSKEQIGRVARWDGSIETCVHQNHLIKVRLPEKSVSKWVLYWLLSPLGRQFIEIVASSTSGLYTLSVNKVGKLSVALPPLTEQKRIVEEVERRLSVIDEMEVAVEANLKRAARLRQSILKKAFEGKLV